MATYLIMFDLNKEGAGYSAAHKKLTDRLSALFPTFWKNLDSTWIVVTSLTVVQIRDDLRGYIDSNDELLVVKSGGVGAWVGFSDDASKWLKDYL